MAEVRLGPMTLPDGLATPGHHLYTARDGEHRIGMLWFAERPGAAFVYDVKVDATPRGHGNNAAARSLYGKLGYVETNVMMAKHLIGGATAR